MEPDDAQALLKFLHASFPQALGDEVRAELWLSDLEPLEFEPARLAVHRLRNETKFFPAWSEFLTAYNAEWSRVLAQEIERRRGVARGELADCRECGGDLYVDVANQPKAVRPCSLCLPIEWQRWIEGHLSREHMDGGRCSECRDLMKHGGSVVKEAKDSVMERYYARTAATDPI